MTTHEGLVSVQAAWNGWRSAEVRLSDLRDVHWFQPAGAPSRLLHAWIDCSDIVAGVIPHDCEAPSARAIQELAGHVDLSTTQRYMHLSPAAIDGAIRLLESSGIDPRRGDISNDVGSVKTHIRRPVRRSRLS